jgi:hypothetical protein
MIQIKLSKKPFAKHIFYKGIYTHRKINYPFELTVEESENSVQPAILVEFEAPLRLIPFNYDKARTQILNLYLPQNENKN